MSKKNYAFPLTLGTKNNNRETLGDVYGVYIEKTYYSNADNPYKEVDTLFLIPIKSVIKKYGIEKLHAVKLEEDVKVKKTTKDGYKWEYNATKSTLIPLIEFIKLYGKLPTLNSGGVKI